VSDSDSMVSGLTGRCCCSTCPSLISVGLSHMRRAHFITLLLSFLKPGSGYVTELELFHIKLFFNHSCLSFNPFSLSLMLSCSFLTKIIGINNEIHFLTLIIIINENYLKLRIKRIISLERVDFVMKKIPKISYKSTLPSSFKIRFLL